MDLTIGIPVYNAELHIARCIDSIMHADGIASYEVIIVNDGSTDNTQFIINKYSKKYKQIRIINTKNEGAFRARDRIISEARGEWIGFVDADDTIERQMYNHMLKIAHCDKNIDIVVCAFNKVNSATGQILEKKMDFYGNRILDFTVCPDDRGLLLGVNPAYWNKIFKRNAILHRLNLDYSPRIMEDYLFSASVFPFIRGVAFVKRPLYNYYNEASSISKKIGWKEMEDAKKGVEYLIRYLAQRDGYQEDHSKVELISVMTIIHLGIAFSINWSDFLEKNIQMVHHDTWDFLEKHFGKWYQSRFLRLGYMLKNPEMIKVLVACNLYRTWAWPLIVHIYRNAVKSIGVDFKW